MRKLGMLCRKLGRCDHCLWVVCSRGRGDYRIYRDFHLVATRSTVDGAAMFLKMQFR